MVSAEKLLTADDRWAMPAGEGRHELVRGQFIERVFTGEYMGLSPGE